MLSPRPTENRRRTHPAISDLDNLEMLLLNDQQPLYSAHNRHSTSNNIRLGMERTRVKRNLGLPNEIEVAGNPKYGNERWVYKKEISTLDGYYTEKQVIYFEAGSVVGWESH